MAGETIVTKTRELAVVTNEPGKKGHLPPDLNSGPDEDACSSPDIAIIEQ